jgi:Xaa-Pro aminopeptidase
MFDAAVFAARREAFMQAIGTEAVAVVRSLPERVRNGDSHYRFRQHSDVFYLTGFVEPETTVVLRPGAEKERVVMFVRPRDPEAEVWDGRRAGIEGAKEQFGADAAYPASELEQRLGDLIANRDELHYALGLDHAMDQLVTGAIARLRKTERKGARPPRAVIDPRIALHELRLIKRPEELAQLRKAAEITCEAHLAAMAAGQPGMFEHELEALIEYTFRRRGGNGPGYGTIVGAGENATILHYIDNRCAIADGDLVLVDAGCEYGHYTADLTRTWPANGRFSPEQRAIYELVLETQKAAVAMAVPGATIEQLFEHCARKLTEGLIELELLEGPVSARIEDQGYKKYFMHGVSHWLGLDVHDAGAYMPGGKARPFVPGMVLTVEPGIYIAGDAAGAPERLRGIGVRIEDDVVITEHGNEVLTAACPKEIAEVEAACRVLL